MVRASIGIAAFVISSTTAFGAAAQVSLYGVTVGEPLSIPECERRSDSVCWTPVPPELVKITPAGMQMRQINLGKSAPRIARYPFFQVMLIDGVVEEVTVYTKGVDVQDEVLSQLVEKFGTPSEQKVETVQNRLGARFDSVVANWRTPDVTVRLSGVLRNLDTGTISATSSKAAAKILENSRNRRAVEPKL